MSKTFGLNQQPVGIGFSKTIFAAAALGVVTACSMHPANPFANPSRDRLDRLTSFSTALNRRDFRKAADFLTSMDREKILDSAGGVSLKTQERLSALKLSTLNRNPNVTLENGKLAGIYSILPVLEEASSLDTLSVAKEDSNVESPAVPMIRPDADSLAQLRKTALKFFQSVRVRNWKTALTYIDPDEKTAFAKRDGSLRNGTAERLTEVDTSAWTALTLKDGKLTGVVLITPDASYNSGDAKR